MRALVAIAVAGSLTLSTSPTEVRPESTPEGPPARSASPTPFVFAAPLSSAPHAAASYDDAAPQIAQFRSPVPREFFFTRGIYNSWGRGFGRGGRSWATDFPKADEIFLSFIDRLLSNLDAFENPHPVEFADPELRRFPFLYALEVGRMDLTQDEVMGLRSYLQAGGFLVIDDFWGSQEWANFEYQMRQVLPGHAIVDLPMDHEIFTSFYEIDEIQQVPNVGNGRRGGPTYERDGYVPMVKGIYDEDGRLMVVINWNTDLGDAWEWADDPYYPLRFSTYAYEMGVNMIVYSMSH